MRKTIKLAMGAIAAVSAVAAAVIAVGGGSAASTASQTPDIPPDAQLAPDAPIGATDQFDFGLLPIPDQTTWRTVTGLTGTVSLSVPADWAVMLGEVKDVEGKTVGDSISVYKPTKVPVSAGVFPPGWVKVDISTGPFEVPTTTGDEVPARVISLQRQVGARTVGLWATQFGQSKRFPALMGLVSILPSPTVGSTGLHLSGVAFVVLPGAAGDVATARAIMESVVLK